MELRLDSVKFRASARRKEQRKQRAQFWFTQMRRVVDAAMEWQPAVSGQPEQVCLALARRS